MAERLPLLTGIWNIPSAYVLVVWKGCTDLTLSSSAPFAHIGYTGFVWVPMSLTVYHGQFDLEKPASPSVVFQWTEPLPAFESFVYFFGCLLSLSLYSYD